MSECGSASTIRVMDLSYRCIVGSYCALLGFFLINSLTALDQFSLAIPVIWILQSAPLLGFVQAVRRKNAQQLIWLSLVVLLYFMHGVLVAFDPARRIAGAAELGLSVLLFCALLLYLRVAQKLSNPAVTKSVTNP
ncbi:MAG: DUF2069 domain-containing protein [Pseudomonadota bacterium]|nr:DUF2069 domain-containing protein [Pseudomonadota bacterium]MEC8357214.1 DUF2069 domain-containing protein [Pseudomonadota bacterium]